MVIFTECFRSTCDLSLKVFLQHVQLHNLTKNPLYSSLPVGPLSPAVLVILCAYLHILSAFLPVVFKLHPAPSEQLKISLLCVIYQEPQNPSRDLNLPVGTLWFGMFRGLRASLGSFGGPWMALGVGLQTVLSISVGFRISPFLCLHFKAKAL